MPLAPGPGPQEKEQREWAPEIPQDRPVTRGFREPDPDADMYRDGKKSRKGLFAALITIAAAAAVIAVLVISGTVKPGNVLNLDLFSSAADVPYTVTGYVEDASGNRAQYQESSYSADSVLLEISTDWKAYHDIIWPDSNTYDTYLYSASYSEEGYLLESQTMIVYDEAAGVTSSVYNSSSAYSYEYDSQNRPVRVTAATDEETVMVEYTYDDAGYPQKAACLVTTEDDEASYSIAFTWSEEGLLSAVECQGYEVSYTYDEDGNVTGYQNEGEGTSSITVYYISVVMGILPSTRPNTGYTSPVMLGMYDSVSLQYDENGSVIYAQAIPEDEDEPTVLTDNEYEYTYDNMNRISSSQFACGSGTVIFEYTYDD